MKKEFTQTLKILLAAVVLSLGISYVYAWTAPTLAPPDGNTSAPLNTGSSDQSKEGNLALGTITAPTQTLEVTGNSVVGGTAYFLSNIVVGNTLTDTGDDGEDCTGFEGTFKFDDSNFLGCTGGSVWEKLTSATAVAIPSNTINLTIDSDEVQYVIADDPDTELQAAILADEPVSIILTIETGATVSSSWPFFPALRNGTLPRDSSVKIINNGFVLGAGGVGGSGGTALFSLSQYRSTGNGQVSRGDGGDGGKGGDAINTDGTPTTIDNTSGRIYAGGGGGAGGAGWFADYSSSGLCLPGGGGGGGAGGGGTGGVRGLRTDCSYGGNTTSYSLRTDAFSGATGTGGVSGTGGNYGTGGTYGSLYGGRGGVGGEYGTAGNGSTTGNTGYQGALSFTGTPGNPGPAGYSVDASNASVTWSPKGDVKGAVKI